MEQYNFKKNKQTNKQRLTTSNERLVKFSNDILCLVTSTKKTFTPQKTIHSLIIISQC